MYCSRCGAENILKQRYCRQCGMLMLTDPEFCIDQRVVAEMARVREGDCQLGRLALALRSVRNSLTLSIVFLVLLSVGLATRGQVHIDLFLLVGAMVVCGWQFRHSLALFREFMATRNAPAQLMRGTNSAELAAGSLLSGNLRRRQTAPLSVTERTTIGLEDPRRRFTIPTVRLDESATGARAS